MDTEKIFPVDLREQDVRNVPATATKKTVSAVGEVERAKPEPVQFSGFVFPKDGFKIGELENQEKDLMSVASAVKYFIEAGKEVKKLTENIESFATTRKENFQRNSGAKHEDYDEEGAKYYFERLVEKKRFLANEMQKILDFFGGEAGFNGAVRLLQKIKNTETELAKAKGNIDVYDDLVVKRQKLADELRDLLNIYGGFSQSDLPIVAPLLDKITLLRETTSNPASKEKLKNFLSILSEIKEGLKTIGVYERAMADLENQIKSGGNSSAKAAEDKIQFENGRLSLVENVKRLLEKAEQI